MACGISRNLYSVHIQFTILQNSPTNALIYINDTVFTLLHCYLDDVVAHLKVMKIKQWMEKMKKREQWRMVVNTLRTGLLNCLNARSRGLNFRHRASSI